MKFALTQIETAEAAYSGVAFSVIEILVKTQSSILLPPRPNRILNFNSRTDLADFHTPGTHGGKLIISSMR